SRFREDQGQHMGFIFDLLLNNPYVPWLLLAAVVLFLYQRFSHRVKVPGIRLSTDDVVGKLLGPRWGEAKLEKQVSKLKKEGNWLAAGKMLEDMDKLPEAAEAYLEGQEFWAAAASFEKMGKAERSAELYLQAGDYKKSAALLIQANKPARAAVLFQEKGNNLEPPRPFALPNQWDNP